MKTDKKYWWGWAKKAAHAVGKGRNWAYIQAIFNRMSCRTKGMQQAQSDSKNKE